MDDIKIICARLRAEAENRQQTPRRRSLRFRRTAVFGVWNILIQTA